MPSPLHTAALEYAARGWHVFPLSPGTKVPIGGRGHLDATTKREQIDTWWSASPNANVGIAVAPSGLVVLDVDVAEGKPGAKSLAEIDALLPDTLTAITGRGGLHILYQGTGVGRRIGFKPGLDLIGDGYIVAAPSMLESGQQYRWNRIVQPVPMPAALLQLAAASRVPEKVQLTGTPIGEGGRNQALFRLACALRDQGIGAEALARALDAENKQRCNPPLDDAELAQIVNSALTRVTPSRDVAIGAVVEQEVRAALAPTIRAQWIGNIALTPVPPMQWFSSGFETLDALTGGGLATRQLFGVIGPPSSGKSALVGEMALHLQQYRPVLQVSTELPHEECMVRTSAHEMEFPWRDGMKGKIPRESLYASVQNFRIKVIGSEDIDRIDPIGHIRAEAQLICSETGTSPFIVVDYVQMLARGSDDQVRHKVGELTMALRMLAQELDTVIIAVFSTSRAYYNAKVVEQMRAAQDPTAYLAAAKECGEIEYDCATLVYLDVDKLAEGATKPAQLAIARCRVGDVGFVGLRARLDVGKFREDAGALAELASEERKTKRELYNIDEACKRLLEIIKLMPNKPWRDMQAKLTCDHKFRTQARDKLITAGVIEEIPRVGYDENHRALRGTTLVIVKPLDVPKEEVPHEDGNET